MSWPKRISLDVFGNFSADYHAARAKFRAACFECGLAIDSYINPAAGPDGGYLTTDVAFAGSSCAEKILVVISGIHGAEGLAGSGIQTGWLKERGFECLPPDVAVLLVHIINPWGCAWGRRQNEDNVDLNRNFIDFSYPLPENKNYEALQTALTCAEWEGEARAAARAQISAFREEKGDRAFASALFQGQYGDAGGIGFGGAAPSWSNRTLRDILGKYASNAAHIGVVDIHTGYGPFGWGLVLTTLEKARPELSSLQSWHGDGLLALKAAAASVPYDFDGDVGSGVAKALPCARVYPVTIEFGTYDVDRLLKLQIDDCWLHNHGKADSELGRKIRKELTRFFYPATPEWLQCVHFRSQQVIGQMIRGLAGQGAA